MKFDHVNRILCLKLGALVYKVSRLSKCQGYLLVAYLIHGRLLVVTGHKMHNFLSLDTQDVKRGQLRNAQNSLRFLTAPICPCDRAWNCLPASDRSYANTPNGLLFEILKQELCMVAFISMQ